MSELAQVGGAMKFRGRGSVAVWLDALRESLKRPMSADAAVLHADAIVKAYEERTEDLAPRGQRASRVMKEGAPVFGKWQPVKTMPAGVRVIVCEKGSCKVVTAYMDSHMYDYLCRDQRFTHWMPLPELPEEGV